MSARHVATALALIAFSSACDGGTGPIDNAPDVRGTWTYVADQSTPPLDFQGSLSITEQVGAAFSGRIELQEKNAQGTVRNRAGVVSGRFISADAIDFDAFLDDEPWRHVGRIRGDSISGSWAASLQFPLTGKFAARRANR